MRAIVNDKMYDTEKSELLHIRNLDYEGIQIYKTENNNYFVVKMPSKKIYMADEQYIKDELGQYNPDKYIELFGEVEEA